jgi:hypothetical protein
MTIPPPGVPFSTSYIAPNSEVATLSQRVDVPMVCLTAEVLPGSGSSQAGAGDTSRSGAPPGSHLPDPAQDYFVMDEVTGLPRFAPPELIPSPEGSLDGGASSRSGLVVTGLETGTLGSPGGMGTTLTLHTTPGGFGGGSGTATPSGGPATAKAIRGLKAPFAVASDPSEAALSVTLPASDLALRLSGYDWLSRGEAMRKEAKDPESAAAEVELPPKPTSELFRQDYEPRPWDWERLYTLTVMQREMLEVGSAAVRLVLSAGATGAPGAPLQPAGIFLPTTIVCGVHALDIGAYNSLIKLYKEKQRKIIGRYVRRVNDAAEAADQAASSAVGALLRDAERFNDGFDPLDLLPHLRAVGNLVARVDSGGIFFEFREVRKVVGDLVVHDDLGPEYDSEDERASAAEAVVEEEEEAVGQGTPLAAGAGEQGGGTADAGGSPAPVASSPATGSPGLQVDTTPSRPRPPRAPSVPPEVLEMAMAAQGAAGARACMCVKLAHEGPPPPVLHRHCL